MAARSYFMAALLRFMLYTAQHSSNQHRKSNNSQQSNTFNSCINPLHIDVPQMILNYTYYQNPHSPRNVSTTHRILKHVRKPRYGAEQQCQNIGHLRNVQLLLLREDIQHVQLYLHATPVPPASSSFHIEDVLEVSWRCPTFQSYPQPHVRDFHPSSCGHVSFSIELLPFGSSSYFSMAYFRQHPDSSFHAIFQIKEPSHGAHTSAFRASTLVTEPCNYPFHLIFSFIP
jgi:hypothetical protein